VNTSLLTNFEICFYEENILFIDSCKNLVARIVIHAATQISDEDLDYFARVFIADHLDVRQLLQ
jgi:hypothetical protein